LIRAPPGVVAQVIHCLFTTRMCLCCVLCVYVDRIYVYVLCVRVCVVGCVWGGWRPHSAVRRAAFTTCWCRRVAVPLVPPCRCVAVPLCRCVAVPLCRRAAVALPTPNTLWVGLVDVSCSLRGSEVCTDIGLAVPTHRRWSSPIHMGGLGWRVMQRVGR
jgi:hypothetical protein